MGQRCAASSSRSRAAAHMAEEDRLLQVAEPGRGPQRLLEHDEVVSGQPLAAFHDAGFPAKGPRNAEDLLRPAPFPAEARGG